VRVYAEISFRAPYGITLFKLRVRGRIGTDLNCLYSRNCFHYEY